MVMKVKLAVMFATVVIFKVAAAGAHAQDIVVPEKCLAAISEMKMPMHKMMDRPIGAMMEQMHGMKFQDFNKDLMAGMRKTMPLMMQGMTSADPDVAFICGMIGHHIGAVEMSKTELKYGKNEEARAMAKKILHAQVKEIEEMSKWVETNAK
jgi:uncharacterized protein (DUF305 family)